MFSGLFGFLIPLIATVYFSYITFESYYSASGVFLFVLCLTGAIISAMLTLPVPKRLRLCYVFVPHFMLYCIVNNLIVALVLILAIIATGLLPLRQKRTRVIFTQSNAPVFIVSRRIVPLKKRMQSACAILGIVFTVLFVLTCVFTVPGRVWQIRAYPINIAERELLGDLVTPSGEVTSSVGYDSAALVIDSFFAIEGKASPALTAGLQRGDVVTRINNQPAKKSSFIQSGSEGDKVLISVIRADGDRGIKKLDFEVTPLYSEEDGRYLIGIYYYDSYTASLFTTIQTLSFTYPDTGFFAATAHASDIGLEYSDTFKHILGSATVQGRDEEGLCATFGGYMGKILHSDNYGSFGVIENPPDNTMPIARKNELRPGKASILSDFEGGEVKSYECYVTGTYRIDSRDVICLIVSDERLMEAGGITRGMSGSPVIQNGKIIGALSNTDSKGYRGYATFAYDMAHEMYLYQDKLYAEK